MGLIFNNTKGMEMFAFNCGNFEWLIEIMKNKVRTLEFGGLGDVFFLNSFEESTIMQFFKFYIYILHFKFYIYIHSVTDYALSYEAVYTITHQDTA